MWKNALKLVGYPETGVSQSWGRVIERLHFRNYHQNKPLCQKFSEPSDSQIW